MVIRRGGIYWADLGAPAEGRPAKRRPVLVVQSDRFTRSRLATVLAVVVTSDTRLAAMPGNVFLPAAGSGLPRDSVADVTALVTLDRTDLADLAGQVAAPLMADVDIGLRLVLDL